MCTVCVTKGKLDDNTFVLEFAVILAHNEAETVEINGMQIQCTKDIQKYESILMGFV